MGQPGRPRRRNKVMPTHHQPQPISQQRQPVKDEPTVQLHDEADLISFRSDALHRFITNQEYLENVTSKHIHSSKIIPPSSFPSVPKRENMSEEELQNVVKNLKPEELYFGDLRLMKMKNEIIKKQSDKLSEEESPYSINQDKEYTYRREKLDKLAELQYKLGEKESFDELESEFENILQEYDSKFNKTYKSVPLVRKHSQNINELSGNEVKVTAAPNNYNPRLVNSLVGIASGENNNQDNNDDSLFGDDMNLDDQRNGMQFIDQFEHRNGSNAFPPNGNPELSNNFNMSMVSNNNFDNNNNSNDNANDNNDNDNNDINHLFNDNGDDAIGNTENQEIDDMDNLIDFDQGENEIIGGDTFDQDFLNQIDHSME